MTLRARLLESKQAAFSSEDKAPRNGVTRLLAIGSRNDMEKWIDIGSVDELSARPLRRVTAMNREFAVSCSDGRFGVVSNTCNHAGGPLGRGHLDGEYIVCPWHNWKFHRSSGMGEPGFEDDRVPAYAVNGIRTLTRRIRWPAKSNALPDRCAWPAFLPLLWMPTIHASPARITCSIRPCKPGGR